MTVEHSNGDRACCSNAAELHCAGRMVERLSDERVLELAEEIWTATTGSVVPVRGDPDPRSCRPGASAQAAYRRHRQQELEARRPGRRWRAGLVVAAAVTVVFLIGVTAGASVAWRMALPVALLTGWRLRFRPSAGTRVWRRQAVLQRRTAGVLQPLEGDGYLVLHDITLPGWPAGLDHLVVGSNGIWVIRSWQRGRLRLRLRRRRRWQARTYGATAGVLRGLGRQATAIAEILDSDTSTPVRPVLCVHGGWAASRSVEGVLVTSPRQLEQVLRRPLALPPRNVERATAQLLAVLRPAA